MKYVKLQQNKPDNLSPRVVETIENLRKQNQHVRDASP